MVKRSFAGLVAMGLSATIAFLTPVSASAQPMNSAASSSMAAATQLHNSRGLPDHLASSVEIEEPDETIPSPGPAETTTPEELDAETQKPQSSEATPHTESDGESTADSEATADTGSESESTERDEELADPELTELESAEPEPFDAQAFNIAPSQVGNGCTYATEDSEGAYADTLCWIDFSSVRTHDGTFKALSTRYRYNVLNPIYASIMDPEDGPYDHTVRLSSESIAGTRYGDVRDLGVEVQLGGGYTLAASLDIYGRPDTSGLFNPIRDRSRHVEPVSFPTWGGAFLGNNGFYELPNDIGLHQPALYQRTGGSGRAVTEISLNDIELTRDGVPVEGYSIVVADAESTDSNERIDWETSGSGFEWLPNEPGALNWSGTLGNACGDGRSPALGDSSNSAYCIGSSTGDKTGTAMLHTSPVSGQPFNVTQTMTGSGLQAVAFGVITARAQVNVQVEERVLDADGNPVTTDDFQATVELADGTDSTSVNTGSADEASSPELTAPVGTGGTRVSFSTSSSGDLANSYTGAWVCTKTNPEGSQELRWPETGSSPTPPPNDEAFTLLGAGEFIDCTVTYWPPYLTLEKQVENGDTEASNVADDFTLAAAGDDAPNSTFVGRGGSSELERRPIAVGDYTLIEDHPDPAAEGNWQYGYAWSDLTCETDEGDGVPVDLTSAENGEITEAAITVEANHDVHCVFTNTALEPRLQIDKTADPAPGELLYPGDEVSYTLTFDNSDGTASMDVDHIDHLGDVLDDADLDMSSIDGGDLAVEFLESADGPRLHITGVVGAGEVSTVDFAVGVKPHEEDTNQRQDSDNVLQGYTLNNFLTPRLDANGDPIAAPNECTASEDDEDIPCTEHPIPAWTVDKGSFPVSGARLNRGGNTHYVLTATKLNEATSIQDLVFTDDLTHVFKTAGWAPDAAVPGGSKARGIYFIDADGNTLASDGEVHPEPAAAYDAQVVGAPEQINDRWILQSDPVDVPDNAVSAELWFAVEAGQNPAGLPASSEWQGPNAPQNGWQYVNYMAADADTLPVQCGIDTWPDGGPDVSRSATEDPVDESIAEACRTQHELNAGHFTIRKDANGAGIDLPADSAYGPSSEVWNLVHHEFEIHDDVDGSPSEHPSQYLCREDYQPDEGWDGQFTAHPGDRDLDDWDAGAGDDSETLNRIRAWNADPDNHDQDRHPLPECGVFNAQPEGSGGQTGRYRGMNLQPELAPGESGEPRDFWLVETKAPTHQISLNGQQTREVSGVRRLAEPIAFRMWPYQDGQHIDGPQYQGKRQLDIPDGDGYLERCTPGDSVQDRPVACVNPTGYLMLVQDTVPMRLPLTGGQGFGLIAGLGVVILAVALGAGYWRRRRVTET